MKQDIEKQDLQPVFLSNATTSTKSSAVPDHVDAASGDASGNKDDGKVNCKDKNARQKSLNEIFNSEFKLKLKFNEAECCLIEQNAQLKQVLTYLRKPLIKGVGFDESAKSTDESQNSNRCTKFNFNISNYSDDEDDFDTVKDI
ncbi:uncharacterized protein TNCT_195801 [Trichonephila clavata]|uniref:Uncharacterized protein n=1 Tax=Trichonephila clavata TaxID=2740835 RepID=A0A8X6JPA9_TRICU|nr:uncharacterized protein TNCT_195801 [Trichonephila clavata]